MNTEQPDPDRQRALELALQARLETLPEKDQRFLEAYLAGHPAVEAEARDLAGFAARLSVARVPVPAAFRERLRQHVSAWVREDVLSRPPVSASSNGFRAFGRWLLGRGEAAPRGLSWPTLVFGRSLAVYLGMAAALALFALLRGPEGSAKDDGRDRAALETPTTGPVAPLPRARPGPPPRGR